VASVQNRYNTNVRSSDDVIDLAEDMGFAFIPWAPVGGYSPGRGESLEGVAARIDASPVQVALAWQLARSPQMLPIPGTKSPAHLGDNVAAAGLSLSDDDLAELATPPKVRRSARQVASGIKKRLTGG
jgi:pyridoxine 4-dehydrogenase